MLNIIHLNIIHLELISKRAIIDFLYNRVSFDRFSFIHSKDRYYEIFYYFIMINIPLENRKGLRPEFMKIKQFLLGTSRVTDRRRSLQLLRDEG